MKYKKVLKKLESNEITAQDALEELYQEKPSKPGKRAFFVKMNITVPDEGKRVNTFLKLLFAIPIPIVFARMGLRFANRFIDDDDIDVKEISRLLKYSKNTRINIDAQDAKIQIKVI